LSGEKQRVEAYLDTVKRLEPDIAQIDLDSGIASIAISLKRIADALEKRPAWKLELADALERLGTIDRDRRVTFENIDELVFQLRK
jgi:hypothetical protein